MKEILETLHSLRLNGIILLALIILSGLAEHLIDGIREAAELIIARGHWTDYLIFTIDLTIILALAGVTIAMIIRDGFLYFDRNPREDG